MQTPELPVRRGSMAGRALLALILMIGFYLLALSIAGGLLALAYWTVVHAQRGLRLGIPAGIGGLAILWSILPRFDRFEPPGPALRAATEPKLFTLLERVAEATGQEVPAEVYATWEVNAGVTQRGGLFGFGSRRVMVLGIPLLRALSVAEFRGVIAHEFGHWYGGDTALGPLIYRTRAAIGRTIGTLADSILHKPFALYGTLFLRITLAVSRRQEYNADVLGVMVAGKDAFTSGLERTAYAGALFDPYWLNEAVPLLTNGKRPPISDGFMQFLDRSAVAEKKDAILADLLAAQTDPYDSHPATQDRIDAIDALPAMTPLLPERDADHAPATSLLADLEAVETALLRIMAGPEAVAELEPVSWDVAAEAVYLPDYLETAKMIVEEMQGVVLADLPAHTTDDAAKRIGGRLLAGVQNVSGKQAKIDTGRRAVCAAATIACKQAGMQVTAPLGGAVQCGKDGATLRPFKHMVEIAEGEATAEAWTRLCEQAGVAAVDIGAAIIAAADEASAAGA